MIMFKRHVSVRERCPQTFVHIVAYVFVVQILGLTLSFKSKFTLGVWLQTKSKIRLILC